MKNRQEEPSGNRRKASGQNRLINSLNLDWKYVHTGPKMSLLFTSSKELYCRSLYYMNT